jgi:hypothetical protein
MACGGGGILLIERVDPSRQTVHDLFVGSQGFSRADGGLAHYGDPRRCLAHVRGLRNFWLCNRGI